MSAPVGPRWLAPVVLAALAVFVFAVVDHTLLSDTDLSARQSAILAAAQALAIVLQARVPLAGWAVSLIALTSTAAVSDETLWADAVFNSYLLVLAILALLVGWRATVVVWVVTTAVTAVAAIAAPGGGLAEFVTSAVLTGLVLTAAAVTRALIESRRDARTQRRESERQRERNALLEERTRIARELHDVVAHHMSVVAVQAEAAQYRVPDPPPELVASLDAIRASAAAGLGEMRRILGVLRADTEHDPRPQPDVAAIGELVESVRAAGRTVHVRRDELDTNLPQGVSVSAYRIVQEALSNALRHAPGSELTLELARSDTGLAIDVRNTRPNSHPTTTGTGHGLVGMRERVAALGGEFDAGPTPDGGYRVRALLPFDERRAR
ncbi:sensor histidine kinase [Nocardia puris]|uniref:histidine kinase n=1 Tax=Nocardia puris TaxID=208602 RepID=A0A366DL37_9NOCA|nr:sensor histidine kinase [Nocardia puris]RBO90792.1 signal transduction histidine kinase [Nocardia puris]